MRTPFNLFFYSVFCLKSVLFFIIDILCRGVECIILRKKGNAQYSCYMLTSPKNLLQIEDYFKIKTSLLLLLRNSICTKHLLYTKGREEIIEYVVLRIHLVVYGYQSVY